MRNKEAKVSDPNEFITCPGEEFEIEYSPKVMPDGSILLEPSGKIDINAKINAYAETTDMSYILKQLSLGNNEVLNVNHGMFGDFTDMPKTYAEVLQLRIDAEKSFYNLPADVRTKFDNDFNRYFATAGTEDWFGKLGIETKEGEEKEADSATEE